jgi:CheY-like chemotaxis protein
MPWSGLPIDRAATRENNVKILLVEDSKPIRRENESALHQAGYEVICAVDGESAVRFAQEQKPDLVLLDMILPKMSGPEVLRQLKSDPVTAAIPVGGAQQSVGEEPAKVAGGGRGGIPGKEFLDARSGNQSVAAGAGERDLPHQPKARRRIFQRSRALAGLLQSVLQVFFRGKIGARQQQQA